MVGRNLRRNRRWALVVAVCGALSFAAAGVTPAYGRSSAGPTLRIAAPEASDVSLDPPNAPGVTDILVLHNVYQGLIGYDYATSKLVPALADRWTVKGSVYTFYLNPKAKFASGNPVTAADVKYSLDRILAFKTAAEGFQITSYITSGSDVRVLNRHTVAITLATPSTAFLAALTGPAASILDSRVVRSHVSKGDLGEGWLADHTAGSGPYMVTQWVKDSHITLTRNPNYWGAMPQVQTAVLEYIKSEPQAVSLLRGGDLDAAGNLLPTDVASLQKSGFQVLKRQTTSNYYLSMNMLPTSPFHSPLVRDAVRYAIDYKGLSALFGGDVARIGGVIAPGVVGYDAALNNLYNTDLAKARSLLAKAGYPNGFAMAMYYQNDQPLLGVPADTYAAKIQSDLARVGIKLTLRGEPSATVFPEYKAGKLPLVLWFFGEFYPDPDVIMSPHGDWNTQATTRVNFNDVKVTNLIEKARTLTDPTARAKLYRQAQQIVAKIGPYAFLFRPLEVVVARKGVTYPWGFWGIEVWRATVK